MNSAQADSISSVSVGETDRKTSISRWYELWRGVTRVVVVSGWVVREAVLGPVTRDPRGREHPYHRHDSSRGLACKSSGRHI